MYLESIILTPHPPQRNYERYTLHFAWMAALQTGQCISRRAHISHEQTCIHGWKRRVHSASMQHEQVWTLLTPSRSGRGVCSIPPPALLLLQVLVLASFSGRMCVGCNRDNTQRTVSIKVTYIGTFIYFSKKAFFWCGDTLHKPLGSAVRSWIDTPIRSRCALHCISPTPEVRYTFTCAHDRLAARLCHSIKPRAGAEDG